MISMLPTLSELVPNIDLDEFKNNSKKLCQDRDKKVMFKLRLNKDDNLVTDNIDDEDAIYIDNIHDEDTIYIE